MLKKFRVDNCDCDWTSVICVVSIEVDVHRFAITNKMSMSDQPQGLKE